MQLTTSISCIIYPMTDRKVALLERPDLLGQLWLEVLYSSQVSSGEGREALAALFLWANENGYKSVSCEIYPCEPLDVTDHGRLVKFYESMDFVRESTCYTKHL